MFEPLPTLAEKRELVVSASLANNNDGVIPVRILNVGGARKLYKGTRLGTVEEIDPEMLTGAVSSSHTAEKWTPPLPETPKLSSTERAALERLLSDYSDIFSRLSADLGRADVLQHSIHTENERPFHQRPYRQPFSSPHRGAASGGRNARCRRYRPQQQPVVVTHDSRTKEKRKATFLCRLSPPQRFQKTLT